MGTTFYYEWEVRLIEWIQSHMGAIGAPIASFFTMLGEPVVLVAIIGFIYWCYDKDFGRFIGINILVGLVLNPMIKNIAVRRRPYFDNPSIKCLRKVSSDGELYDVAAQGYSFPSAHSMNSAIVYGSIAAYKKKKLFITLAIVLPILVATSRFSLGVHYPTDVLVGLITGVLVIIGISFLMKKVKRLEIIYVVFVAISLIGVIYCRTEDFYTGLGLMIGFFSADIFERRHVNFRSTRNPVICVIRIVGGFATYFALSFLLKLPFSEEFLESSSMGSFSVRAMRYAIIAFVAFGLYPMLFPKIEKLVTGRRQH